MANVPEEVLEEVRSWDRGQIGDHISNQKEAFISQDWTWADWKRHATEVCTLCKVVLERIIELDIVQPKDETPLSEVISYFRLGRTSRSPEQRLNDLIRMIQNS